MMRHPDDPTVVTQLSVITLLETSVYAYRTDTYLNFKPRATDPFGGRSSAGREQKNCTQNLTIAMAALYRILALVCIFVFSEANIFQGGGIRSDAVKLPFVTERETTNRITARDVGEVASRLPRAIGRSLKLSAKSFVTSSAMLFPVALVLDINQMKPFDAWLMKGASTSIGWAKVGACFAVRDTFDIV